MTTVPLFRDNPYSESAEATVLTVTDRRGIVLDQTVFYATSGGQPGDTGSLSRTDGGSIPVLATVYDRELSAIAHVPGENDPLPEPGEHVSLALDWDRRYRHMRMHTALHLLSAILPYPVTGGQIGADESRLDFDIPEAGLDKDDITEKLQLLVAGEHDVSTEWITDVELEANPGLVKTMSVKPPKGSGKVRLVRIGEIDLQPCGGTHVANTREIGTVYVSKIEKKGRQNRRVRIRFNAGDTS